jgi:hypothetical protein
VEELRTGDDARMFKATRLHQYQFEILLAVCEDHGLTDGGTLPGAEKLAMFLFILAGNNSYRDTELQFCHSPATIKKYFHQVLRLIVDCVYPAYVKMPALETPLKIKRDPKYNPWFEHCVGALDGHIFRLLRQRVLVVKTTSPSAIEKQAFRRISSLLSISI